MYYISLCIYQVFFFWPGLSRCSSRPGKLQAGQVVFVDLAGSERVGKSGVHADATGGARAFSSADRWFLRLFQQ